MCICTRVGYSHLTAIDESAWDRMQARYSFVFRCVHLVKAAFTNTLLYRPGRLHSALYLDRRCVKDLEDFCISEKTRLFSTSHNSLRHSMLPY